MSFDEGASPIPQTAVADANRDAEVHPPEFQPGLGGYGPSQVVVAGAVLDISVNPDGQYVIEADFTGAQLRGPDGNAELLLLTAGDASLHTGRLVPPSPDAGPSAEVVPLHSKGRRRRPGSI